MDDDIFLFFFFFQAEDGIRALYVTGVQTCALPIFWWCRLTINTSNAGLSRSSRMVAAGRIGRASCRERVEISVVAVSLKKKRADIYLRDIQEKISNALVSDLNQHRVHP